MQYPLCHRAVGAERWASGATDSRSDAGAEAIGSRLPGRAGGCPPGPPTDPYVRNSRIRFLKQSRCYPRKASLAPQSTGLPWSGLVSSMSLPCLLPADALLDGAFPPVGRLGLTSPPSPVLCAATTATLPLSGSFACRSFPDTLRAPMVCGIPSGLVTWWKHPGPRQGFWSPGPPLRVL